MDHGIAVYAQVRRCGAMDLRTGTVEREPITAQKAAEELQNLLMQEIDHRAKNVLAVVQAALRLTPRNDNHAYAQAIEGRVEALARAHTLLAEGRWTGPDLLTLAHANWCRSRCRPPARRCRSSSSTVPQSRSPLRRHRGFRWLCTRWQRTRRNTGRFRFQAAGWRPDGRLTTWPACCRYVGTSVAGHRSQRPPRGEDLACALEGTIKPQRGGTVHCHWEGPGLVCEMVVPLRSPPSGDTASKGASDLRPSRRRLAVPARPFPLVQ